MASQIHLSTLKTQYIFNQRPCRARESRKIIGKLFIHLFVRREDMMYAYADESGHTGSNLLDPSQPTYFAAAAMSLMDIDAKYGPVFTEYAQERGFQFLHAAEMGLGRLLELIPKLTKWIQRDTIRFFIGNMDKRWFIVCKLFDFLFDPVENRAAPSHVYLVQPLRYAMLVKLAALVEDQDLGDTWDAIHGRNYDASVALFSRILERLSSRVEQLPDQRSREIISEVISWAVRFPEELGLSFKRRRQLFGHYPNVAMFTPLMVAIEKQSEHWKSPVRTINHDRQSQFQVAWQEMHGILSNASDKPFHPLGWA